MAISDFFQLLINFWFDSCFKMLPLTLAHALVSQCCVFVSSSTLIILRVIALPSNSSKGCFVLISFVCSQTKEIF